MTHDDDDEDDEEEGFYYDGFRRDQQDPLDRAWRFGFSLGPDGMRFQELAVFGHVLREMEEIFSQLGRWEGHPESGHFGTETEPTSLLHGLWVVRSFWETSSDDGFLLCLRVSQ